MIFNARVCALQLDMDVYTYEVDYNHSREYSKASHYITLARPLHRESNVRGHRFGCR